MVALLNAASDPVQNLGLKPSDRVSRDRDRRGEVALTDQAVERRATHAGQVQDLDESDEAVCRGGALLRDCRCAATFDLGCVVGIDGIARQRKRHLAQGLQMGGTHMGRPEMRRNRRGRLPHYLYTALTDQEGQKLCSLLVEPAPEFPSSHHLCFGLFLGQPCDLAA